MADEGSSFILALFVVAIVVIVSWLLGRIPGLIAKARKHPYVDAVTVCGYVGIFIWPAWVVALVWAFACPKPEQPRVLADQCLNCGYPLFGNAVQCPECGALRQTVRYPV